MSTPNALEGIARQLVNRGLPVDYAEHAAAELADHYHDLHAELGAAGFDDVAASAEALRRLGDSRTLVKKTVREYQRRYWCGRWPLVTFLLGPIPVFILPGTYFGSRFGFASTACSNSVSSTHSMQRQR